jgi:2'-5' RNA ligase
MAKEIAGSGAETEGYNVIIIPSKTVGDTAIRLSKRLSRSFDTYFTLDGKTRYPHITIYQSRFPRRNFEALKESIREISATHEPFHVRMSEIVYCSDYACRGFVSWLCKYRQDSTLVAIQRDVLRRLKPLREGLMPSGVASLDKRRLTANQRSSIKRYGSLVPNLAFPFHITIGRIRDVRIGTRKANETNEASFLAENIAIGRLGEHGVVNEILEDFELGSASATRKTNHKP